MRQHYSGCTPPLPNWPIRFLRASVPHLAAAASITLFVATFATSVTAWNIEVVDSNPDVGDYSSLALDPAGLPRIAYWDANNNDLRYAEFNGSSWTIEVAHTDMSGQDISLALDSTGAPHILHIDVAPSPARLIHTWREGLTWQSETVDDFVLGGIVAEIDTQGAIHASYIRSIFPTTYLRHALKPVGQAWQTELITASTSFASAALTLDSLGLPHVVAQDLEGAPRIRYFYFDGSAWREGTPVSLAFSRTTLVSLALDPQDQPRMAYTGPGAVSAFSTNQGQSWTVETVDTAGEIHGRNAVAVDNTGMPHLVYWTASNDLLKYAWKSGSTWYTTLVDVTGEPGGFLASTYSLQVGSGSLPRISYGQTFADESLRNLKFASVDGTFSVAGIQLKGFTRQNDFVVVGGVAIVDQASQGVPDATLRGEWTLPDSQTVQQMRLTGPSGTAIFWTRSATGGTWTLCLTDARKTGLLYRPDLNRETCDSISYP
ncbi:MAG: hypothetical protein HYY13_11415 [Nitrospirae bacterium]|nr:hypothetical protein [Nitrospirota bacterium]